MSGFAQLKTVHKVVNYEPTDYVAHNQNWQVVQKSNGIMYFANGDGVLEYDGTTWGLYYTVSRTNVLSVDKDQKETIFYGGVGEVGYLVANPNGGYECKEIELPLFKDLLESEFFWNIHVFDHTIIFRSDNAIIQYSEDEVNVIDISSLNINKSFSVGAELWITTDDNTVYAINPKKKLFVENIIENIKLKSLKASLQDIIVMPSDSLLLVSNSQGLFIWNGKDELAKKYQTQLDDLEKVSVDNGALLPSGQIIISTTNSGVYVLSKAGEITMHYNNKNGLKTNAIRGIYYDRESLLWFTSDAGISKVLFNRPYSLMPDAFDKIKGNANAIIESQNKLYIATNEGAFIVEGKENELSVESFDEYSVQAFDIADVGGDVITASTGGLFMLENGTYKVLNKDYCRAILALSDTYIIVGGRKSIFQLQKLNGEWHLKDSMSISDEILHLEQDPINNNIIWGGLYSSGVTKIHVDTITHSCTHEEFNPDFVGVEGYILPFQGDGKMMFAPKSSGIYNFNDDLKKFEYNKLVKHHIGEDVSCWLVKEDIYKNLYIEDSGPIYILRHVNGKKVLDSISLANLNVGYINDIFCAKNGITWLVGEQGIVRFDPNEIKEVQQDFYTILNGVYLNGDSVLYEGSHFGNESSLKKNVINYGYHNISFAFTSPQFASEESQLYAYRLVGFDKEFSDWSNDRKAIYTNLNEGSYTFQVKSLNADGVESEIAEFDFNVLPPWFRTYLAYGVYLILLILFIYLIVRIYSIRLKRMNKKLQDIVIQKTQVITANMNELALQKEQLEVRNNEIIGSIHYAQQLQKAILPSENTLKHNLKNYFVYYRPKDIVAGDFYWFTKPKEGNEMLISVADCTGHGVPGALVSVVCSDALNRAVNEYKLKEPNEILDAVNNMVIETFNADNISDEQNSDMMVRDGMDLALCSLNFESNEITFSGANNPLWIFSKETYDLEIFYSEKDMNVYELKGDRLPIGGYNHIEKFTSKRINVTKGDRIYMFTDGIVDQFGNWKAEDKIKKFKRINLVKSLISMQNLPVEQQQEKIHVMFDTWKGTYEQIDDVTLMGIEI